VIAAAKSTFNRPLSVLNGLLLLVWLLAMVGWVSIENLRYGVMESDLLQRQQAKAADVFAKAQEEAVAVVSLLRSNQLIVEGLQIGDHNKLLDTSVPMLKLPYVQLANIYNADGSIAVQAHRPEIFGLPDELKSWLTGSLAKGGGPQATTLFVSRHLYLLTGAPVEDLNGLAGFVVIGTQLESQFDSKLELATGVKANIYLAQQGAVAGTSQQDTTEALAVQLPRELAAAGLRVDLLDPLNAMRESWRQSLLLGVVALSVAGAFMLAVAAISSRALGRSERKLRMARDEAYAASQLKSKLLAREEDQRRRLDLLVRCSNVGSYEWDAQSKTATYSARLIEMLGYPPDTDTSRWRPSQMIDPRDRDTVAQRYAALMESSDEKGLVSHVEPSDFRLVRPDGNAIWVHSDAISVRDSAGMAQKFLASFIDITPVLAAEEDTRNALVRQQQLNELRSRFVAMTSHEFRTPLATILSSAELLKYYGARLPEEEKASIIETIEAGVQRMTQMLDKILNIGKAEAGMLEFRPERINLRAVCEVIVDNAKLQHPTYAGKLAVEFDFEDAEGVFDEKLLRHIFENLLSNALKYSPAGGEVRFSVRRDGEAMVFQVKDSGIGIPADEMADLFSSFHRASNVGDIPGTGLGLAIVKSSVDLHGGAIQASSEPGQGTCFTVRL
jgi:PAS domain S-box-containing protein